MTIFFCNDRLAGERVVTDTLDEAIAVAEEFLKDHREAANFDGEWLNDVEDLTVGTVSETGDEDDDIVTHRATFIGSEKEGFDCAILPVPIPVAAPEAHQCK
ncbi:hypothetical protein HFO56_39560 [Rhizobium laguerreae]|uniref:hypothetical protein n=1 Tax=Rhizobium laguerreae TaxID=1076926 RepID=UPI001C92771E|nr:hypothetical protein [Rhizobium laguerreae]MBY3158399.1 hypothetical protein [Rhizobium laguerreae]